MISTSKSKDLAHSRISWGIRTGVLIRPDKCSNCLKACKPYAHHEDDERPLDVEWLCSRCHADIHIEIRKFTKLIQETIMTEVMTKAISVAKGLI